MQQRLFKLLYLPIIALLIACGMSTQAFAASTWLPKGQFKSGQHVYLDPKLDQGIGTPPVNLDGLEDKLKAEGAKQGIEYFFVMTLQGDEAKGAKPFAVDRIDELIPNWLGTRGFPSDNYVVYLVIRKNDNWVLSSYAVNISPALASKGLPFGSLDATMDTYGKGGNNNPNALLPRTPKAFAGKIAETANAMVAQHAADLVRQAEIAKQQAAQRERDALARAEQERQDKIRAAEEARQHEIFMQKLPGRLALYGTPTLLALIFGFLFFRFRTAKTKAQTELNGWKTKFDSANQNYLELEKAYWGFLKNQGDNWSSRFKDETLKTFSAAVKAYADLSIRVNAALNLISQVEKNINSANIFTVGKLHQAVALLTTTTVKITGETLPLEQRTLFGALVAETDYQPDALLQNMEELFSTANDSCAGIMKAMKGADENRQDIERLLADLAKTRADLEGKGLTFAPYELTMATLETGRQAFIAILSTNPLKAFEKSEVVERGIESVVETLKKAISFKESLVSTESKISTSGLKIATARSQAAVSAYAEGEPVTLSSTTCLIAEEGFNPDVQLETAREELSACVSALMAGKLDEAEDKKAASERAADAASKLVDTILAARAFILKQVPVVRGTLNKLDQEIPGGESDVADLKVGFLAANYDGEPKKLDVAKAVSQRTDAQLAKVRKAFADQRYIAGRKLLEETGADIDGARNGLVEVHTRLAQLIENRKHAKATVEQAASMSQALSTKLSTNDFTTSAATDSKYAALGPVLKSQQNDVAKDVTDWPAAAKAADELVVNLKAVDSAIDSEKAACATARAKVEAARSAFNQAGSTINAATTREKARQQHTQAADQVAQVEAAVKIKKSDWLEIARKAESASTTVANALATARQDKAAADAADSAIDEAERVIGTVSGRSYSESRSIGGSYQSFGGSVSADTSSAQARLREAGSAFNSRNYERAKELADSAKSLARQAEDRAESQTAALIAAAVAAWEAAERRRREEEERRRAEERRRQQEEDDRRRRDEESRRSSSSSNDWGGSSGSSGSSWSGSSGSSGGGDF